MRRLLPPLVLLSTALAGALAGCGSDDDAEPEATPSTSSTSDTSSDDGGGLGFLPTAPSASGPASLIGDPLVTDARSVAEAEASDLLGITPENIDENLQRLRERSTSVFANQLDEITGVIEKSVRTQGVSRETTVLATGIAAYDPPQATVLVAARTEQTGPGQPTTTYDSLRIGLVRETDSWLVDSLDIVGKGGRPAADDALESVGLGDVPGHVSEVLSYTPETVLSGIDDERDYLTDSYGDEYADLLTDSIAPLVRKRQTTSVTSVSGAALVDAGDTGDDTDGDNDTATLLLFIDSENTSGQKAPMTTTARVTVTVELVDGVWLIAGLDGT